MDTKKACEAYALEQVQVFQDWINEDLCGMTEEDWRQAVPMSRINEEGSLPGFFYRFVRKNYGINGSASELAARTFLAGRRITKVAGVKRVDGHITIKVDGKRGKVTLEIKTACGAIDYCEDAQYIGYWPEPDGSVPVEDSMVVFTRRQWHDFVTGYTGRGQLTKTEETAEGTITHIQSFRGLLTGVRPKASKPIAEYIYSCCEDKPTLREWKEAIRQYRPRGGTASLPSLTLKGGYTMNEIINEVKALRHLVDRRIAEAEEAIARLEAVANMFPEDSAASEDIITRLSGLYDEVRIERALKHKLSLCEFCKLSPEPLCDKC